MFETGDGPYLAPGDRVCQPLLCVFASACTHSHRPLAPVSQVSIPPPDYSGLALHCDAQGQGSAGTIPKTAPVQLPLVEGNSNHLTDWLPVLVMPCGRRCHASMAHWRESAQQSACRQTQPIPGVVVIAGSGSAEGSGLMTSRSLSAPFKGIQSVRPRSSHLYSGIFRPLAPPFTHTHPQISLPPA